MQNGVCQQWPGQSAPVAASTGGLLLQSVAAQAAGTPPFPAQLVQTARRGSTDQENHYPDVPAKARRREGMKDEESDEAICLLFVSLLEISPALFERCFAGIFSLHCV
jgi:hypothetical protein